uniref:Uncharacterized protein n=1 Tax=Ditylenchus dipsaci TaxID=166011 RepID=A0A915ESP1_9BILA
MLFIRFPIRSLEEGSLTPHYRDCIATCRRSCQPFCADTCTNCVGLNGGNSHHSAITMASSTPSQYFSSHSSTVQIPASFFWDLLFANLYGQSCHSLLLATVVSMF